MNKPLSITPPRLASLDILRGFDLFLLVSFQPVLWTLAYQFNAPQLSNILSQFDHEMWEGSRFWDPVMPLLLFMTGTSMPFSFPKFKDDPDKDPIYCKIIRRFTLLFIFGMIVQGNPLGLSLKYSYLYFNTLQAITTGCLIVAIILLHCSFRQQLVVTVLLLLIYWAPMTSLGDFISEGNFTERVDKLVLGHLCDGIYWGENGTWNFSPHCNYIWIWSSPTFGATVILGTFAGKIMKVDKDNRRGVVQTLPVIGVAPVVFSLVRDLQMPTIKRLWTSSMTPFSGGPYFLLMGAFYYWIDYKGRSRGLS